MADGLVTDTVLFEGGGLEDFVATRGELLPEDERLLAQQWLLRERSVYEVEGVRPGESLRLRDIRTGDRLEVTERTASRQTKTGMLLCTHVLPAGDINVIFGGIEPIGLHQRDALLALLDTGPEPEEVIDFLSQRYAPPEMQNTEGEPLVICEASFRVPDPAGLTIALDSTYRRVDSDELWWHEYVTTHGREHVRAVLRLAGDELHVETNSEARHERVVATVSGMQPGVALLGERRRGIDEIEPMDEPPDSTIDLTDPQVQEAVRQIIRQQEQVWLDEPIPALAGVTPRQAAEDPTRRPDLIRLLDDFAEPGAEEIAMSPRRLREALELD
jgi:hypothetical protein